MIDAAMLTEQLNGLLKQQQEALNDFAFLGSTEEQTREFDYRAAKIRELRKRLGQPSVFLE